MRNSFWEGTEKIEIILSLAEFFLSNSTEKWKKQQPQKGDHIKVERLNGLYTHHGIFVSKDEVIHFTGGENGELSASDAEVVATSLEEFLEGGEVFVKIYGKKEKLFLLSSEKIVERARDSIGEKGYNILFNNCEHFANYCTIGIKKSKQVTEIIEDILLKKKDKLLRRLLKPVLHNNNKIENVGKFLKKF